MISIDGVQSGSNDVFGKVSRQMREHGSNIIEADEGILILIQFVEHIEIGVLILRRSRQVAENVDETFESDRSEGVKLEQKGLIRGRECVWSSGHL